MLPKSKGIISKAQKELIVPFSRILEAELKKHYTCEVIRRFESFVDYEVTVKNESTKIQIALDSPFMFQPPDDSEYGVKINNFLDLCVDKLLAFFGRAEARDAIDLFFILKHMSLTELSELALKKDPGFDLYWLAIAFQKVNDLPDELKRLPVEMLVDFNPIDMKKLFSRLQKETMDKVTGR